MSGLAALLPACRSELVVRPLGDDGQHVVKDPGTGAYYELGPEEAFLLTQLDGRRDPATVCAAFERHFAQSLPEDDLDEFVALARERKLLDEAPATAPGPAAPRPADPQEQRQSLLYWRK